MVEGAYMVQAVSFIAAALVMAIGSIAPAYSQGLIGSKACENVGKYPESAPQIRAAMMLALILVETAAIYCLLIAIAIIVVGRPS